MKVLKNNFNETNNITDYPKAIVCEKCESELEYEKSDLTIGAFGAAYCKCPLCGYDNFIDDEEEAITLTIDNIEFPVHFYHTSKETGAIDITNEEIKKRIREAVIKLRNFKEEDYWGVECGNLYLLVTRCEDEESYEITVSKDHYSTYIPFEEEDYNRMW